MITQIINAKDNTMIVFLNPNNLELIRKEVEQYGLIDNQYLEPMVYVNGQILPTSNINDVLALGLEYGRQKSWNEEIKVYKEAIEKQKKEQQGDDK